MNKYINAHENTSRCLSETCASKVARKWCPLQEE